MLDAMLPFRLAQAATELAVRNVTLAMSFWTSGAQQMMGAAQAAQTAQMPPVESGRSSRTVRSWYRHPDQPAIPFMGMPFWPSAALQPWLTMMKAGGAGSCMLPAMPGAVSGGMMPWGSPMLAPMQAWTRMWLQGPAGMATGPMAFALMAWGMPQAAAWPTAEAGAHAMEASRKAAEGMEQMFSTYRSDGGHAIAQIIFAGRRLH